MAAEVIYRKVEVQFPWNLAWMFSICARCHYSVKVKVQGQKPLYWKSSTCNSSAVV